MDGFIQPEAAIAKCERAEPEPHQRSHCENNAASYAAPRQGTYSDNMLVLAEAMDLLEASGNVWGMADMLRRVTPHIEAQKDLGEVAILERMREQVARAQEHEKLAGGYGSLFAPNHPLNVAILAVSVCHPQWRPWWEEEAVGSSPENVVVGPRACKVANAIGRDSKEVP